MVMFKRRCESEGKYIRLGAMLQCECEGGLRVMAKRKPEGEYG